MIGGVIRQVLKLARKAGSAWRRTMISLAWPGVKLGRGVTIGAGTIIKATDGGTIEIGARTAIAPRAVLVAKGGRLTIGPDGYVGDGAIVTCREQIDIGPDVLIAEYVVIRDQDHAFEDRTRPIHAQGFVTAPVVIGADVWLGAKATVVKGAVIGEGAVVGAMSVATGEVPPFSVVAGQPAKVLRTR